MSYPATLPSLLRKFCLRHSQLIFDKRTVYSIRVQITAYRLLALQENITWCRSYLGNIFALLLCCGTYFFSTCLGTVLATHAFSKCSDWCQSSWFLNLSFSFSPNGFCLVLLALVSPDPCGLIETPLWLQIDEHHPIMTWSDPSVGSEGPNTELYYFFIFQCS